MNGSLADLISAAEAGKRIRVLIGTINLEADDVRIDDGVLCASFLNRLTKNTFDTLDPNIKWNWNIVCSSGVVKAAQYRVGSNVLELFGNSNLENVTWFVDDRVWTNVLETGANGTVVSGSKSDLLAAVQNGADIRYKIYTTEEIVGFALANTVIIQQADTLRWSGEDVSAMHIRSVSVQASAVLPDEVDFRLTPAYWCFSLVSTLGNVQVSRWTAGEHTSQGSSTSEVARVEWYVNT